MGFISAPTNLASPSAIGSTTPNTGAFTTLLATGVFSATSINAGSAAYILNGSNASFLFNNRTRILCPSDGDIQFANNAQTSSILFSVESTNTFAQRNSTNAQTFRLYRTFTDASNYERLSLISTRTTRFAIAAENAGTGSARSLEISFYTSASDPTSTDITSGCFSVWKNSGTGIVKLWANDGGTMKSIALV